MRRLGPWLCVALLAVSLPALAQKSPKPAADDKGGDKTQTEISADQGIEWDKNSHVYIARGNAKVTRGDRMIEADRIMAYHRGEGTSKSDIYRVDAEGSVRITSGDNVMTGDRGIYDNDNKVARLTGRNLTLVSPDSKLTARDSFEYWDDRRMAVARGNVVVIRGSDEMRADQVVAYFEPKDGSQPDPQGGGSRGKQRVARIEAYGKVYIASCQGYAHADKALYDPNTGTAVLTGNVRMTRGREQVNGETVEMNTRTGYTRVVSTGSSSGGSSGRVVALIEPNKDAATPDTKPTDRPGAPECDDKSSGAPAGAQPKNGGAPAAAQPKRQR
ncbi:LptA/OstA family protein [Vineibacter terrae]|uniref:LptA/OstA family protein n=1 Tax=Vineibacter terrae TaxID=2586908 RepID=UPI002E352E8B|nr:LptA/OstA family protein [Vineibacter terrae]HEX2890060.1 LptA/OstA family protein [Vineibacter terrae]